MPFLSPAKILIILVIALVVLGPDKLPKVAKQIGGLLTDFRKFRERLETDVRGSFPDLPSTEHITRAVRSPLSFLSAMADTHESENGTTTGASDGSEPKGTNGGAIGLSADSNGLAGGIQTEMAPPGASGRSSSDSHRVVHQVRTTGVVIPDDPGMN